MCLPGWPPGCGCWMPGTPARTTRMTPCRWRSRRCAPRPRARCSPRIMPWCWRYGPGGTGIWPGPATRPPAGCTRCCAIWCPAVFAGRSPRRGPPGSSARSGRQVLLPRPAASSPRSSWPASAAWIPSCFACPMDAWWFRLPRRENDPQGLVGNPGDRFITVMIDRGGYWQCATLIPKGTDGERRAAGLDRFMAEFDAVAPWLEDRTGSLRSWDEVKLLDVRLDRLRRWHRPGLLCIGDAAHAMSPVFGIGINLAVEDAVAAARHLAGPLRAGTVRPREVRAVQRRRWPTTAATQALQRLVHAQVIEPVLAGRHVFGAGADRAQPPRPVRIITTIPWLSRVPAYFLAYGALRERPPPEALR